MSEQGGEKPRPIGVEGERQEVQPRNEDRAINQYPLELARDLVYNLVYLKVQNEHLKFHLPRGNPLFEGVKSSDPNQKVSIGKGRDFRLIKEARND
jgi:hypothetical protein